MILHIGAKPVLNRRGEREAGEFMAPNTGDKLQSSDVDQASSASSPCSTAPNALSTVAQGGVAAHHDLAGRLAVQIPSRVHAPADPRPIRTTGTPSRTP